MIEQFSPLSVPEFYRGYVQKVNTLDLLAALEQASQKTLEITASIPEELGTYAYAQGKWTVKELLNHVMDAERVFAFRALCFSRNDKTPLPGFDENAYVPESNAHGRSVSEIAKAMIALRSTTLDLFKSFTPEMLKRVGVANNNQISVEGLGYVIAGHEVHHGNILTERYLKK